MRQILLGPAILLSDIISLSVTKIKMMSQCQLSALLGQHLPPLNTCLTPPGLHRLHLEFPHRF